MTSHEAGGEELPTVLEIGDWTAACLIKYAADVVFTGNLFYYYFLLKSFQVRLYVWLGF